MHVLAAIELGDTTEPVLLGAIALAARLQASLTLLHVGAPEPAFLGYDVGPDTVRDSVAHELRAEHRELSRVQAQAQAAGVVTRALMVQGPTVEKVLSQAERLQVDYIVVGSKGHSIVHEALVGSVARGVVHGSKVPVLVVPVTPPGAVST